MVAAGLVDLAPAGGGPDGRPANEVSLAFLTITRTHRTLNRDGSVATVTSGWDLTQNARL